ncbi:MAG: glycosyltransferase, partial [Methylobacteriaceae bacterium]|nr:glycosyltransferase [Methylobacteriaceae bacterium]
AKRIVSALEALDYPRAKVEIKFVMEVDDRETIAALTSLHLPARYEIIVAPLGMPRTKPRALNVALPFVRGELVVVYDAEDEPEPRQLRDAADRFAHAPATVACLQAKLAIDNTEDSWLTRLFTIEYAALFDVVNPGLAALGLPIPLGGTSNHFRTEALRQAGGWDAWNVTEDADRGIRLARCGYDVETLDSTTFEEAPARLGNWLGQRRRWLKGWMQTLIVHGRAPLRLAREIGAARAVATGALMSGTILGALFGPFFLAGASIAIGTGVLLESATSLQVVEGAFACFVFLAGVASALWTALLGLRRRGWLYLAGSLPLLPVYYMFLTLAAWLALIDLTLRPFVWSKTEHGLARTSRHRGGRRRHAELAAARPLSGLVSSQP